MGTLWLNSNRLKSRAEYFSIYNIVDNEEYIHIHNTYQVTYISFLFKTCLLLRIPQATWVFFWFNRELILLYVIPQPFECLSPVFLNMSNMNYLDVDKSMMILVTIAAGLDRHQYISNYHNDLTIIIDTINIWCDSTMFQSCMLKRNRQ